MKRIYAFVAVTMAAWGFASQAQIVTTDPVLLQEQSKNVVLTYHADSPLGNGGLKNLPASEEVYAHIGVITNESVNVSDWRYTVTEWPDRDGANSQYVNLDKNHLKLVAENTYTLTIGDIRSYFGIKDPSVTVEKIALVFRNADGSKEGKTASGGDIYVDVLEPGFGMSLTCDGSTVIAGPTKLTFTANTTEAATISITVNDKEIAGAKGSTQVVGSYTFSDRGSYRVKATATNADGKTIFKAVSVAFPGQSTAGNYPGGVPKMGAVKNSDGSVTFCLAAPNKSSVVLVPSWDNYDVLDSNIMKYQDYNGVRYFWTTVRGLENNRWYPYYYLVDAKYRVADPYAHLILDCYSDKWLDASKIWPDMPQYPYELFDDTMLAVYRGDIDDYKWSSFTIPDQSNLVVYEMLFRDFTGTEGEANGNGTVRQAIAKIPYLSYLGVNAVELMPIMEFNGNNSWGYNTNFYMAPDKAYGSPKDYKDFIDACHKNGIAVILDIVLNQSDGLHPWYQMYDIKNNPFYNEVAPHQYSVLNDWNQDNALVQQQWTDVLTYWMKAYNVDGFRFDLVKGLGDNNSYGGGTDSYNQSRIDRMKRLHGVIKSVKKNGIHINENLAGAQEEIELGKDGQLQWANINGNSCQFTMGFAEGQGYGALTSAFLATLDGGRPWGSTVAYAESHDEERMAYKNNTYGTGTVSGNRDNSYKRLGSLAAQMLMTPGPKMIWQFGELGADQATKEGTENNTSPKRVIWSWLNEENPAALYEIYAQLCNLRKNNPDLFSEKAEFATIGLGGAMTSNRVMRLTNGDKEVMVFINPNTGGANKSVAWNSTKLNANNNQLICASPGFSPRLNGTGTSVNCVVPPHSFAVFATNKVVGVRDVIADDAAAPVVRGGQGEIVINGDYDSAVVYNLAGQRQSGLNVAPGLYIVNVDGNVTKVVVR